MRDTLQGTALIINPVPAAVLNRWGWSQNHVIRAGYLSPNCKFHCLYELMTLEVRSRNLGNSSILPIFIVFEMIHIQRKTTRNNRYFLNN